MHKLRCFHLLAAALGLAALVAVAELDDTPTVFPKRA
jgi:hypothetical protein